MKRRDFLKKSLLGAAALTVVPRHVLGGPGHTAPSDQLTKGIIGVGGMGRGHYGYAGTRELNEALVSRFVVVDMPVIGQDDLCKLLLRGFPSLKKSWAQQLAALFDDLRAKCSSGEISARALDLRGLLTALRLMERGLSPDAALEMGIINKAFAPFERQLTADVVWARVPRTAKADEFFGD